MEVLIWFVLYAVVAIVQWIAKANREERSGPPLPRRHRREEHPLSLLATQLTRGETQTTGLQELTVSGRHGGWAVAVVAMRPYQGRNPLEYRAAVSRRLRMHLMHGDHRDGEDAYYQEFVRGEVVATSNKVLSDSRVQRQLRLLFKNFGIDEIHFEDGWIKALRRSSTAYDYRDNTYTLKLLGRLVGLARASDEALGKTEVKATVRYKRREGETCPYCRDDLGADLELVTCARCKTIHHGVCFSELGHCTAMGCQSQRSLPVLQRDEGLVEPFAMSLATCELCGAPMAGAIDAACTSERCGASLTEQRRHGREQAFNRARTRREQRTGIRLRVPSERLPPPSERLQPPPERRQA